MNQVDGGGIMVASLKVSPSAKALLRAGGFRTLRDVVAVTPIQLARELGMDPKQVLRLVEEIKESAQGTSCFSEQVGLTDPADGRSALELLSEEKRSQKHIVTYCKALDGLLKGGVPLGEITEFCGLPGCGKTQVCMQLVLDAAIPAEFGGLAAESLYIDTEGSFAVERVRMMADALMYNLRKVSGSSSGDQALRELQRTACEAISTESILEGIHYCRVHNHTEQVALVMTLDDFLKEHPRVKLVVIDSVAFLFRQDFPDMAQRTRLLSNHAQRLNAVAAQHKVAVAVTNQVVIKGIGSGGASGPASSSSSSSSSSTSLSASGSYVAPALGESWSHAITHRVMLERLETTCQVSVKRKRVNASETEPATSHHRRSNSSSNYHRVVETVHIRRAKIVKSPYLKDDTCTFVVNSNGVRDQAKS